MTSLERKKGTGQFFDVVRKKSNHPIRYWERFFGSNVINLRPNFYKRYPKSTAATVLLLLISSLFSRLLLTRAEIVQFYPKTCLGTWQNPQEAQDRPEILDQKKQFVQKEDAASLNSTGEQIFCGGFIPEEFEKGGSITRASISLLWQVGEETEDTHSFEIIIPAVTSTEPLNEGSSTLKEETRPEETPATENTEETPREEKPESQNIERTPPEEKNNQPEPSEPTPEIPEKLPAAPEPKESTEETVSFFSPFILFARAQETDPLVEEPQEPSSKEELPAVEVPEPIPLGPPIIAELEEISSSTDSLQSLVPTSTSSPTEDGVNSSTPEMIEPPAPDERFLKISYSLDGQNWFELKRVGLHDWRNLILSLPVASWNDLKKLQVAVEGIPTTLQTIPPVLLDGLFLEVQHETSMLADQLIPELEDLETKNDFARANIPSIPQPSYNIGEMISVRKELEQKLNASVVVSAQYQEGNLMAFKAQDDIFLLNGSNGEIQNITATPDGESEPSIQGKFITWTKALDFEGFSQGEIFLYNLETKETSRITNDSFIDMTPYFHEGYLYWVKVDARGNEHTFRLNVQPAALSSKVLDASSTPQETLSTVQSSTEPDIEKVNPEAFIITPFEENGGVPEESNVE